MISVLFVCLGNICRSPMAEGLFIHFAKEEGLREHFHIDSSGTGAWHIGEQPDPRMRATAKKNGIHLPSRARQLHIDDFSEFDYIIAMDRSNYQNILNLKSEAKGDRAEVLMMRDFDNQMPGADVPDPYYGGDNGFDKVYDVLVRSNRGFLAFLKEKYQLG